MSGRVRALPYCLKIAATSVERSPMLIFATVTKTRNISTGTGRKGQRQMQLSLLSVQHGFDRAVRVTVTAAAAACTA